MEGVLHPKRTLTGANKNLLSPDGYELDIAYMARPGAEENSPQIFECELHLLFEVGLVIAILTGTQLGIGLCIPPP